MASGRLTSRRVMAMAFVAWLVALAVPFATRAGGPDWAHEAIWRPSVADSYTEGLYHLDEANPHAAPAEKDTILLEPTVNGGDLLSAIGGDPITMSAPSGPLKATNAVPLGASLPVFGDAEFVREGVFGGGLRLKTAESGLTGVYGVLNPHDDPARTVAFWFRADALPQEHCTVFSYFNQGTKIASIPRWPGRLTITLTSTGDLVLDLDGKGTYREMGVVTPGEWCHVAFGWGLDRESRIFMWHVNGRLAASGNLSMIPDLWQANVWTIGNGPLHRDGLVGTLDEVYISRSLRVFYEADLGWEDRAGSLKRQVTRPYFRDAADQVLRLDFERGLTPELAPPGTHSDPIPDPEAAPSGDELALTDATHAADRLARWFPDGVEQHGLRLMPDGPRPHLTGVDLLPASGGTLAFWIRPLNWDNFARWFDTMGRSQRRNPVLRVEQDGKACLQLALNVDVEESVQNPLPFNPGRWTHIAICWQGKTQWTYVNGERLTPWGSWALSFTPWEAGKPLDLQFLTGQYESLIDDLRVFRRPLAPSEMRNLYGLFRRRLEPQPLPPFDASIDWNGVTGQISAAVVPLMPDVARLRTAELTLLNADSEAVLATTTKPFADEGEHFVIGLSTDPLPWGRYAVRVRGLDAAGEVLGEVTLPFERIQPPWWNNTLGISDKAPPDWSPMQVSGETVKVDRRDIHFGAGGLPAQIVADGQPLLAAPISVETMATLPESGALAVRSAGEARVQTRGQFAGDGFTVQVDCDAEFDGYMWYTMTLTPNPGASPQLSRFNVRIPYRSENAAMYHWWSGANGFRNKQVVGIGAFPATDGVLFHSEQPEILHTERQLGNFIPYLMLTGDNRGMAWFAENDAGWTPGDAQPAIVVERHGERTDLVLQIVTESITLTTPRTIQFGLQPIPVKRETPGWRQTPWWGVTADSFSGNNLKGDRSTQFNRHPDDFAWNAVQDRIEGRDSTSSVPGALKKIHGRFLAQFKQNFGRAPLPQEDEAPGLYHDLRRMGTFPPMCREWVSTWQGKTDAKIYDPTLVNYLTWVWNEWVERTFIEGVYMDDAFNVPVYDYPSPVTYLLPDGRVQPGFQWRGHREAIKRMRQVLWDHGKVPHMCVHTTHTYFIPYHSFFDVILDGEDFYAVPPRQADFINVWTLPRLRFMNSAKWGQTITWLNWKGDGDTPHGTTPQWTRRQERAFIAGLMLNDLIWARHDYQLSCFDPAWLLKSQWRVDPAVKFHPYWNLGDLASTSTPDLTISAWTRPGRCLLVIANLGSARVDAAVTLDPRAMGFGDAMLNDLVCTDVDPGLLVYFDNTTPEAAPTMDPDALNGDGLKMELEAPLTLDERRAKDPDGALHVKDNRLTLPVRPRDYRLIEFTRPQ